MADVSPLIGVPNTAPSSELAPNAPDVRQQIEPVGDEGLQKLGAGATDLSKFVGQVQTANVTASALTKAQSLLDHYQTLRGEDAMNAEAPTQQAMNKIFNDAEGQLSTPDQTLQFQSIAREYQTRYFGGRISEYANDARNQYYADVNAKTLNGALSGISSDPNSDANFGVYLNQTRGAYIKALQLRGDTSDPSLMADTVNQADAAAWKARIVAVAPTNPALALQWTQQNQKTLGTDYPALAQDLQQRADKASAEGQVDTWFSGVQAQTTNPPSTTTPGAMPINNPGNLRPPGAKTGFMQYPTMQAGMDAMAQQLVLDNKPVADGGHGLNTIASLVGDLVHGWAPASENNTAQYVQAVSAAVGVDPNAQINLQDPSVLAKVQMAMVHQEGGATGETQSQIYQQIANSGQSDQWKAAAYAHADQVVAEQALAQQNQDTLTKAQSETYATNIATQIWTTVDSGKPVSPDIIKQIDSAPIDYSTKASLRKIALDAVGQAGTNGYGTAYTQTFDKIIAPYGTPGKIADASQILQLQADGQLTASGAKELIGTLNDTIKSVDDSGLATATQGILHYAFSQISYADPSIPGGLKDPQGEILYNTKFLSQFYGQFNAWKKAGKNPWDFLNNTANVNQMITGIRSQAAKNQAMSEEENGADTGDGGTSPGGTNAAVPAPPPPSDVKNISQWSSLVNAPPGKLNAGQWGSVLGHLMQNPKQNIPDFNQMYGPFGYDGATLVGQLAANAPNAEQIARQTYGEGPIGR